MRIMSIAAICGLCAGLSGAPATAGTTANACKVTHINGGDTTMSDTEVTFQSPKLQAFHTSLNDVFAKADATLRGGRKLTLAADEGAYGGVLWTVNSFALKPQGTGGASCDSALRDAALALQTEAIAGTPVSYPKDTPTAEVSAVSAQVDLTDLFLIWEPAGGDLAALNDLTSALSDTLSTTSGLKLYKLASQSWAFQRSGLALVDTAAGEAVWYSFRAVRALAGRRG